MSCSDLHIRLTHMVEIYCGRVEILPSEELLDLIEAELQNYAEYNEAWNDESDRPLPEDSEINAAFPTRTGRHDLYAEAMRLVGAKYSKSGLVALVNWLLHRIDTAATSKAKQ